MLHFLFFVDWHSKTPLKKCLIYKFDLIYKICYLPNTTRLPDTKKIKVIKLCDYYYYFPQLNSHTCRSCILRPSSGILDYSSKYRFLYISSVLKRKTFVSQNSNKNDIVLFFIYFCCMERKDLQRRRLRKPTFDVDKIKST